MREEVVPRMIRVMEEASFILGPDVALFEEHFAAYIGARLLRRRRIRNGGLQLALRAMEHRPRRRGDHSRQHLYRVGDRDFRSRRAPGSRRGRSRLSDRLRVARRGGDAADESDHAGSPLRSGRPDGTDPGFRAPSRACVIEDASQAHGARWNGRGAREFRRRGMSSVSIPARISGPTATAARSSPTIRHCPIGCACCATSVSERSTNISSRAGTAASIRCKPRCST